ncbi:MAG: hypothetical protein ACOY9D_04670 [Pseudomonadota bacterium]
MKQPVFAILVVWLMMSACSKQDEQVTAAEKPAVPAAAPVVAEQAKPVPAAEAPAPVQAAAPVPPLEKPQAKAAGGAPSHEEGLAPRWSLPITACISKNPVSFSRPFVNLKPKSFPCWKLLC